MWYTHIELYKHKHISAWKFIIYRALFHWHLFMWKIFYMLAFKFLTYSEIRVQAFQNCSALCRKFKLMDWQVVQARIGFCRPSKHTILQLFWKCAGLMQDIQTDGLVVVGLTDQKRVFLALALRVSESLQSMVLTHLNDNLSCK